MTPPREDLRLPLAVATWDARQTIGVFADAVGLSASALRQYAESGLLTPARVEERTGYRYYSPDQQQRAIWIRRLRDAGLGLQRIRTILDGESAEAESVLDDWLADADERRSAASDLVTDLKASLRARSESNPVRRTSARFDGAVLAEALLQVSAASATDGSAFEAVLIELDTEGASVVSTDRYLLIARLSVPCDPTGPGARVCLRPDSVLEWLRTRRRVELVVEAPTGRDAGSAMRAEFRDDDGAVLVLNCLPDVLPRVQELLRDDSDAATRVVFERDGVLRVTHGESDVALRTDIRTADLRSAAGNASGSSSGPPCEAHLSAGMLARIAGAATGPLLTCDIRGSGTALSWRAPSEPGFVALVMPRGA